MRFTFFDPENWREITATLARNKTRTLLTAFGIFWGTAMLAMLYGGSHGLAGMMNRHFAGMSTNSGFFMSGTRSISHRGFNKGSSWQLTLNDVRMIRKHAPAVDAVSAVATARGSGVNGNRSKTATVIGVDEDYSSLLIPVVLDGRFINSSDIASAAKVVVLGKNVATELFGGESPVGRYVAVNNVYYKVVGVADQMSDVSIAGRIGDSFLMPLTTLQKTFNMAENIHFVVFSAPEGKSPADNEEFLRRYLGSVHSFRPDDTRALEFEDIAEQFEQIGMLFTGISILALFVGAGSLLAGVIGVGNIMWIIVKERTREIGIRRAIGARPADIMTQVLCEAVALTLVAGTAGVCFAALVLGLVDHFTSDPLLGKAGFEISFNAAVAIVLAFFVLGSAAGTIPALRTLKIKPIEALNDK
ncbi:MAG: ABC transporter permease [Muribaculaceae bacterium]|nr:ABC transporter permease [Muribaculaceae bacterium]